MSIVKDQLPNQNDLHTELLEPRMLPGLTLTRRVHSDFIRIRKHISAFLNTDGGKVYCGLDSRGVIIGLEKPEVYKREIEKRIKRNFDSDILSYIRVFRKRIDKKNIVIIEVDKLPMEHDYCSPKAPRKVYFFRVNKKTISANEKNLDYILKVVNYDSPLYQDYHSQYLSDRDNEKVVNMKIQRIGNMGNSPLYKYMDLETALLSLENKNLRFVEPTQWEDQYEGRFYNAIFYVDKDIKKQVSSDLTPFLYACCFTTKRENEAAWKIYAHNRTGLAARCVEFRLNRQVLIAQITKYLLKKPTKNKYPSLFFGKVQYESNSVIENVHNSVINEDDNFYYHKYFDKFSFECYLNLLLLKRASFEHEQEVRVFIIPPDHNAKEKTKRMKNGKVAASKKNDPIYVDIRWEDIIEEVRIDKHCSEYEKSILQRKLDALYEKRKLRLKIKGISFIEKKKRQSLNLIPLILMKINL